MKAGKRDEAEGVKAATSGLKQKSSDLREQMQGHENSMNEFSIPIPNTPSDLVPAGKSEEDNEVVSTHGEQVDKRFM